jgi:arginase
MASRTYAILQAPSSLGLQTPGVEQLAPRLLELGLAQRLNAPVPGRAEPPAKNPQPDPETGILNPQAIATYAQSLAEAVGPLFDGTAMPVVLGGDCTILLGSMLALRRRGRYGLMFIDGHADFFQPEAEPNGEGASMELAWATGRGPSVVADIAGLGPLVRSEDVVAFGYRDGDDQREYNSQPLPADLLDLNLPTIRRVGLGEALAQAISRVTQPDLDGFFIHFDVDVLDDAIMPAVDFRLPGGLSAEEVKTVLSALLATGKAVGVEVTIFNPTLDKDGQAGATLVKLLAEALRSANA